MNLDGADRVQVIRDWCTAKFIPNYILIWRNGKQISPSQAVMSELFDLLDKYWGSMEMRDRFTLVLGLKTLIVLSHLVSLLSRLSSSPCPICSPLISFHLSSPHLYSISLDENYRLFISSELFCLLTSLFVSSHIDPSLFHLFSSSTSFSNFNLSQHFSVVPPLFSFLSDCLIYRFSLILVSSQLFFFVLSFHLISS